MLDTLRKLHRNHNLANIIYLSSEGYITLRTIEIRRFSSTHVIAHCYLRNQSRTFEIERILAVEKGDEPYNKSKSKKVTPGSNLMWESSRFVLSEQKDLIQHY